jgi:hypothetical protein
MSMKYWERWDQAKTLAKFGGGLATGGSYFHTEKSAAVDEPLLCLALSIPVNRRTLHFTRT